jgi:zinc transporter ZupT
MNVGTLIHNMLHWLVIYTGFLVNFKFWVLLTLAIFFHSIPQNLANYLMNPKDIKPVVLAALWWVIGSILLYPFQKYILQYKLHVTAFICWALLYLVISDILPEFKKRLVFKYQVIYLLFWIVGIFLFFFLEHISKLIK